MESLDEHNKRVYTKFVNEWWASPDMKNGIACPDCGSELVDSGRGTLDYPPAVQVHCLSCRYIGKRYLKP